MKKVGVLASYNGSTFKRLQEALLSGELKGFEVVVVISNNTNAAVLESAKNYGIKTRVINQKTDKNPDEALLEALSGCDIVLLSGYMKKLSAKLVDSFFIINSHPALLPNYGGEGMYGRFVHEAVIKNKETYSGTTFHKIDEEYDKGEILLQKSFKLSSDESVDSLEQKVKQLEQDSVVELFLSL
ncbi:MAG: formyltransferase family protein [Sulfurimonas sp.]|jgi:phosphoribosylglycinamide formyltransferase-1|nr:formyltransferase family protein [Sulfurimonadaceae bacterium]